MTEMTPNQTFEACEIILTEGFVPFIWGPPGIGKTRGLEYLAKRVDRKLYPFPSTTMDPTDLTGMPKILQNEDGQWYTTWTRPEILPSMNEQAMIFLDELLNATTLVQANSYQILWEKKAGWHPLGDDVWVVAASNRVQDRGLASRMPTPMASRVVHLHMKPDANEWVKWALDNGVAIEIAAFVRMFPDLIMTFDPSEDGPFSCPRTLEMASGIIKRFNKMEHTDNQLRHNILSGTVGYNVATQIESFLRMKEQMPDPDAVILNPDNAEVPKEPSTIIALIRALVAKADPKTAPRIFRYGMRMSAEYSILLTRDLLKKDKTFANSEEAIKLLTKQTEESF